MKYRIHIDSPRHRVHNEYFVEFRRTDLGAESVHTEPNRATWLALDVAKIALGRLRSPQYRLRCRLLNELGDVYEDFSDGASDPRDSLTLHNCHKKTVWRERRNGVALEIPITLNKATDKFYFVFPAGPDLSVIDGSIQGDSPAECFEKFVSDPHLTHLQARYVVDDTLPVVPEEPPNTVRVALPNGGEVLVYCPGLRS